MFGKTFGDVVWQSWLCKPFVQDLVDDFSWEVGRVESRDGEEKGGRFRWAYPAKLENQSYTG
jgi:hypothetical protein